jgi:hypothetical protein
VVSTFTLSGNETARSIQERLASSWARGLMRCAGESSVGTWVKSRVTSITAALSGPYASTLNTAMIGLTFAAWTASRTGEVVSPAVMSYETPRRRMRLSRRSQRMTRSLSDCPP